VKQSAMFSERQRMRSACFNRMMQYSVPVSNVSSSDYVTTGKPPAAFFARKLTSLSTCRDVIGCFDLPQTQRQRNAVQFSAAVCGGSVA